jgi:hypothetical protein
LCGICTSRTRDPHSRSPVAHTGCVSALNSVCAVQLLAHFGTSLSRGLTQEQVKQAQAQHGYNELPPEPEPSLFKLILDQFDDLLVKILMLAAVVDLVLAIVNGETGFTALVDPFVIALILAANAAVGVATETNAAAAIAALREMEAESARCLRGGVITTLPVRELVPGDIVEVRVGDKAPADCYVIHIHTAALRVDQSIVTGESGSVDKVAGAINVVDAVAQDKINMIFSGSMITSGRYAAARHSSICALQHSVYQHPGSSVLQSSMWPFHSKGPLIMPCSNAEIATRRGQLLGTTLHFLHHSYPYMVATQYCLRHRTSECGCSLQCYLPGDWYWRNVCNRPNPGCPGKH